MGPHPSYLLFTCLLLTFKLETISSQRSFQMTPSFLPPPEVREGDTELWFTQILDHFNPTDSRVWKQKYFINDTFYEDGGPIFLMIGGEVPASGIEFAGGSWIHYAKNYKALLVKLEHRFYGDSHPIQNLTVERENLRYLSSEQALGDLAYFITKFKEEKNLTENKVIAFGGSYPGSLAVWFRLKYPHLVHGSVSSSAPLLFKINYKESLEVVAASIVSKGSNLCLEEFIRLVKSFTNLLKSEKGRKRIEQILKLRPAIDTPSSIYVFDLSRWFMNYISNQVKYNEVDNYFALGTLCSIMTNESYGDPLQRFEAAIHVNFFTGEVHQDLKEAPAINKNVSLWQYQRCTEFGLFPTTDSPNQPFGSILPISSYLEKCKYDFGVDEHVLQCGVERTNKMYGGKNPNVTRVVFINGSIDPLHRSGVLQDLNEEAPAIFINGTSHCADMSSPDPRDPVQLTNARMQIQDLIGKWLKQD